MFLRISFGTSILLLAAIGREDLVIVVAPLKTNVGISVVLLSCTGGDTRRFISGGGLLNWVEVTADSFDVTSGAFFSSMGGGSDKRVCISWLRFSNCCSVSHHLLFNPIYYRFPNKEN